MTASSRLIDGMNRRHFMSHLAGAAALVVCQALVASCGGAVGELLRASLRGALTRRSLDAYLRSGVPVSCAAASGGASRSSPDQRATADAESLARGVAAQGDEARGLLIVVERKGGHRVLLGVKLTS